MQIASSIFAFDNKTAAVTMDTGEVYFVDVTLPPDEQFRRMLADWLAAGGEIAPYVAPEPPVPEITQRQIRLWLVRNGIALATVDAAIEAMPEPARTEAMIEWNGSTFSIENPRVIEIAAEIGLTDIAMLKQAFRDAALI
jgi:hypothetical protein